MERQLITVLDALIDSFDRAEEDRTSEEPMMLWLAALAAIESRPCYASNPRLERARLCLLVCQVIIECWATVGFHRCFLPGKALVQRARAELTRSVAVF